MVLAIDPDLFKSRIAPTCLPCAQASLQYTLNRPNAHRLTDLIVLHLEMVPPIDPDLVEEDDSPPHALPVLWRLLNTLDIVQTHTDLLVSSSCI